MGPDEEDDKYFSPSGKPKDYWDSDEALESLKMEKTVHPEENNTTMTKRLFEEAAPQAAYSIIHLAMHATNENTRMNAAKYVTERVLGKVGDGNDVDDSPLEKVLKDMNEKLEQHANEG